jgi:hypothetical protein
MILLKSYTNLHLEAFRRLGLGSKSQKIDTPKLSMGFVKGSASLISTVDFNNILYFIGVKKQSLRK